MYTFDAGKKMSKKTDAPTVQVKGPPSTLTELYALFIKERRTLTANVEQTYHGYGQHIVPWVKYLHEHGVDRPDEVTHELAVGFLAEYAQRPAQTRDENGQAKRIAAATVFACRSDILTFERWLKDAGYSSVEPMHHTHIGKVKSRKKPPTALQDLDALLDATDGPSAPRDCAYLLLALDTGARASELLLLNVSDIDLANRKVTFRAEITKSKVERIAFLTDVTANVLGWYWQRRDATIRCAFATTHTHAGKRLSYEACRKEMMELSRRAGLEHRLEIHSIRRAFASWMATKIPMHATALLLGHSLEGALGVTSRYVSLSEDELRKYHAENSPVLALEWVKHLGRWVDGTLLPPYSWGPIVEG